MITLTQKLNVVSIGVPPIIHLSQYDSDFSLVFELYASTGNFTLPSGTTAEIRGTKADGNGYDADATVSGTTITVTGDEQMTAAAGCNVFEIALYKSGKRLNTINFILQVEHAALDADTITSESVLKELNAIIEGAATATQAAQDADAAADRAEAAANDLSGTVQQVATNTQDIANLKDDLSHITGIGDEVKEALLACFDNVAWANQNGEELYQALYSALYGRDPYIVLEEDMIRSFGLASVRLRDFNPTGYQQYDESLWDKYIYDGAYGLRRICYPDFNKNVESGKLYQITWDLETLPTSMMGVRFYTEDIQDYVDLGQEIMEFDTGWLNHGDIVKVPSSMNNIPITKVRFQCKGNTADNIQIASGDIKWFKVEPVENVADSMATRMLTKDDLLYHGGVLNQYPYNSKDAGHADRLDRICYWNFAKLRVVPGASYRIEFDKSNNSSAVLGIDVTNENGINAYNNHQTVADNDFWPSGYQNSGYVLNVPSTINNSPAAGFRISFKPNSGTSGQFTNPINWVRFTKL